MTGPAKASAFAANARAEARALLSRPPYTRHRSNLPNPVARAVNEVGHAVVWLIGTPARWLWHHLGAPSVHFLDVSLGAGVWVLLAALGLGAGGLVAAVLVRRRSRVDARSGSVAALPAERDTTKALVAAIAEAEREGRHDQAVRLRFQLGLVRLQSQGVIANRLTLTSDELRRILRSPVFDELAARHEAIAYAEQPAAPGDALRAQDGWDRLLAEVRSTGSRSAK